MKSHARRGQKKRKTRLSFSLDPEIARYVKAYQGQTRAPSLSAALQSIIEEKKRRAQRQELQARTKAYYDTIPPGDEKEDSAWGEFAESQQEQE